MSKVALITGATSGIGLELAKIHASKKGDLILVARRADLLNQIKNDLETKYGINVYVIPQDLADPNGPDRVYNEVKKMNLQIDYLINNAGFGGHGFFADRPWIHDKAMIDLNVIATVALTRFFLPDMIKANEGRILNIASMAGFIPGPLHSVYFATKSFVISFSEAIANELSGTKVTVTVLCPGPTATGFFEAADMKGVRSLKRIPASAKSVAEKGYSAMLKGKTVSIPGAVNKMLLLFLRFMPRSLITKISGAMMKKE